MSDAFLTRDEAAAEALVTGLPGGAGELRALSAGSLALLERAHNPLASAMLGGATEMSGSLDSVIEFVWIHAVDEEEAVRAVLSGESMARALRWGMGVPVEKLAGYTQEVLHAQSVLRGVAAAVDPEKEHGGTARKNEPSPHSLRAS